MSLVHGPIERELSEQRGSKTQVGVRDRTECLVEELTGQRILDTGLRKGGAPQRGLGHELRTPREPGLVGTLCGDRLGSSDVTRQMKSLGEHHEESRAGGRVRLLRQRERLQPALDVRLDLDAARLDPDERMGDGACEHVARLGGNHARVCADFGTFQ